MKKIQLNGFSFDPHPLDDNELFVTYLGTQDNTGHTFAADFIKKKLSSDAERQEFANTCKRLKNGGYHPLFAHFFDGVLTDDGQGVLIWRQIKDLVPLRRVIAENMEVVSNRTSALRLLAKIAMAMRLVPEMELKGHGMLTVDNVFVDTIHETPVLVRHGLLKLWITIYGDKGALPPLICPPEYSKAEDQLKAYENQWAMEAIDSFGFGSLIYQMLTRQLLKVSKPFDLSILEKNLPGWENLFLRELIASCVAPNKDDRPSAPFASHTATFNTLLQKQVNPVTYKTFCQACANNGDDCAKVFAEQKCEKPAKPPFLHGVKQGQLKFQKPVAVSFIVGRKVVHNPEAFAHKISCVEPGKRIIFINVFGGYQKGKSTTLYLLSGNNNYVLGSGTYETTRGVCVDGPYRLSDLDSVFRNVPGFNEEAFEMAYDPDVLKENPYIFLIDIEGYDGSINGFDEELNKRLYETLAKPYLALSSTVILLADKSEGLAARNYAAHNLKLQKFSDASAMGMINLIMVIRNVDKYSAMGSVFPYNDPWKKEQYKGACAQFRNQFGKTFEQDPNTCIDVAFYPLAMWDDRGVAAATGSIPMFDKSFILMARGLLSTLYNMKNSTHVTDRVGAAGLFAEMVKSCDPLKHSTSQDDLKEQQVISERQKAAYKAGLMNAFENVKSQVISAMIKEVETAFQYFTEHISTFTSAELDKKRDDWSKLAQDMFDHLVRDQEKLAVDSDSFGLLDAARYSTLQELEKFISERQLVFTKEVLKKHCETFKCKLMKILPKLSDRLLKDIEHELLSDSGWDYYVKNYKNVTKFASDYFGRGVQEDGILTSSEVNELSANIPADVKKWQIEYIDGVRKSFIKRVQAAFDYARVRLAKSKSPKITQDGPDRKIKGQKGFVERTIVQEWKAPDGTSVIEKRDIRFPASKKCLIL